MDEDDSSLEIVKRNWKLVIFRWIILIIFCVCLYFNIKSVVYYIGIIAFYSDCSECTFTTYHFLVLIITIVMIGVLLLGMYLTLKQNIRGLRVYIMSFFLLTWFQMILIIVMKQRFPLTHDVHSKWQRHESLNSIEKMYGCCGVFGPDDYLLKNGELPSSCFHNNSMRTSDLRLNGCLNENSVSTGIFCEELIVILFQIVLVIMLIGYYTYLKKLNMPTRSIRTVIGSHIVL